MQSIFSIKKDKLYNEKKRLSWHFDSYEIFKHGRSKGWTFLND